MHMNFMLIRRFFMYFLIFGLIFAFFVDTKIDAVCSYSRVGLQIIETSTTDLYAVQIDLRHIFKIRALS